MLEEARNRSGSVDVAPRADGDSQLTINVVSLNPPDRWQLDLFGGAHEERIDDKRTGLRKNRTRLDMVFSVGVSPSEKAWSSVLGDRIAREIEEEHRSRPR